MGFQSISIILKYYLCAIHCYRKFPFIPILHSILIGFIDTNPVRHFSKIIGVIFFVPTSARLGLLTHFGLC